MRGKLASKDFRGFLLKIYRGFPYSSFSQIKTKPRVKEGSGSLFLTSGKSSHGAKPVATFTGSALGYIQTLLTKVNKPKNRWKKPEKNV